MEMNLKLGYKRMILRENMQLLKTDESFVRVKTESLLVHKPPTRTRTFLLSHLPAGKLLFKMGDTELWFVKVLLILDPCLPFLDALSQAQHANTKSQRGAILTTLFPKLLFHLFPCTLKYFIL